MASTETLSMYTQKLRHPLREIRERALQLLAAKIGLGWDLDDEISCTRDLIESLLEWFSHPQPTLQHEALELLSTSLKTKSGRYIICELGVGKLLTNLRSIQGKLQPDVLEFLQDIIDSLQFMNTVESDVNVPRLTIPSVTSCESDYGSGNEYYKVDGNIQSSRETSVSNDDLNLESTKARNGVIVLLFPWAVLSPSDTKTLLLIEDSLKLLKSTRRCCRFIRDVFLRDFPAEIFLNRPSIIQSLLMIADGKHGNRPGEALLVLLSITKALIKRLQELSCLDVIHETNKTYDQPELDAGLNLELQEITGNNIGNSPIPEDALVAIKQLPAPIFALNMLNTVLTIIARNIVMIESVDSIEALDLKEHNLCLRLIESSCLLLMECVSEKFWTMDHSYKTHRDIAHKTMVLMRLLGEVLTKYRKSFIDDPERFHHRVTWIRMIAVADALLYWSRESALPPSTLVVALQSAQLDPALDIFYPELDSRIAETLKACRITGDQEHKSKYRELKHLYVSMEEACRFMKNKNSCRDSKNILTCIKNSLPMLEILQNETYLKDIGDILLKKLKDFDMNDSDWAMARSITLTLMAFGLDWVRCKFYSMLTEMVKEALVGDEKKQAENEKSLTLICDVGILTEICCHGLSSHLAEIESNASMIIIYLLRGRLMVSESCWWRLLASLLPLLPLVHVYAAHDTQIGKSICKSLEPEIAECMGVSKVEVISGLVRLMFVRCPAVQLDASHTLCKLIDEEKYLPPRETLRADVLLNAIRRITTQDFNIDTSSSPTKSTQTIGLQQMLDVLKQDLTLDSMGTDFIPRSSSYPTLEPSMRRSTLQQLALIMRQQDLHEAFIQHEGIRIILAILRMSLLVDDYLAFAECAISCVSVLNSVCFVNRHTLSKIPDLLPLLMRVILIFPANDSAVVMSAQVMALVVWSGFALQELDSSRRRVAALPLSVTDRTKLPFYVNSYWKASPNAEHSPLEWLLSDEASRLCVRVRWWCAWNGARKVPLGAPLPPAPHTLRASEADRVLLQASCPLYSCTKGLIALQNATSHRQVLDMLAMLESYISIMSLSRVSMTDIQALPWQNTERFLSSLPASPRDTALLITLLQFTLQYMDYLAGQSDVINWITTFFLGKEETILTLLSIDQLYPQQTPQEDIEVTQLHINIVKVLLRCIICLEDTEEFGSSKIESLLKILLSCLERVDLKNFHMLGYLNELMRCIRYTLHSRHCKLSEDALICTMSLMTSTLNGCASGGGRKGQACRLDAILSLLACLKRIDNVPVQRWSELWEGSVVSALVKCTDGASPALRSSALQLMAALSHYAQMLPHLLQAIPGDSLIQYAADIFAKRGEANIVRAAAASLLTALTARTSTHSDILECHALEQLKDNNFIENCLQILIDFCSDKKYNNDFEPNIPVSLLDRRPELEVRSQKNSIQVAPPTSQQCKPPPTAELVSAMADVLHNVSGFPSCPVKDWNDRGLYRILFRCASWSNGTTRDVHLVRVTCCRALAAVTTNKHVRGSLAVTKDCLHSLLTTVTPIDEDACTGLIITGRTQALLLVGCLVSERVAAETLWRYLRHDSTWENFFNLILQCLHMEEKDLQDAALFCLSQLMQSALDKKTSDTLRDEINYFENLSLSEQQSPDDRYCSGDSARNNDCMPDYLVEEICKRLMRLYQKQQLETRKYHSSLDDKWTRICSCLSSLFAVSKRSRVYGTHARFPRILLATLQGVRDQVSMRGKPAELIRNADNNPVLRTLHWLLNLINSLMIDCQFAKEAFAEDNLTLSLNRLWNWCMMTEQLRFALLRLLKTFTNDCPKAWASMCNCVGGRNLIDETCLLLSREATLQSRTHSEGLLVLCVDTLRHCVTHHHCRTVLLKNDALSCIYKLRVKERLRGGGGACWSWARLVEAAARHADVSSAVLSYSSLLPAAPATVRRLLMVAIAHAAHQRQLPALHSNDLLELLSGTLLAGDVGELVSAARAVWALAANNHKAKLKLRSAGVASSVNSAIQRLQRSTDPTAHRALQLLTYTSNVLQNT